MNATTERYREVREMVTGKSSPKFKFRLDKDRGHYYMDGHIRRLTLEDIEEWTKVLERKLK